MTILELFLLLICLLFSGTIIFLWILLRRSDDHNIILENFLIDLNTIIAEYKNKIDSLFEMNIHYYDETIFNFVEDTKQLREQINEILKKYEDLSEYIYPEQLKNADYEPKELLGIVKRQR